MALQERAMATREAIVRGAAIVFETNGYGTASLTQVADISGVTKGALYFHFKSKEDLAKAVIDEQHRRVTAESKGILTRNEPALASMILMCRQFGLQLIEDPIVRAGIRLTLESTSFGHQVQDPYDDWINTMTALAEQAHAEEHLRSAIDPALLARYIVASFTGVQMVSEILTKRTDIMQRIGDMWAILLPGIIHEKADPTSLDLYLALAHQ